MGEVREYCKEYGLADVTKHYVKPEIIRKTISKVVIDRLWKSHLLAKKPPFMIRREDLSPRFYSHLPKHKAKLALLMEVGELNFRANRKYEAIKKYGSIKCLEPACPDNDSLEHVKTCFGYSSRLKEEAGPYEIIDFLVELDTERMKKFRKSLMNHRVL